MKNTDLMVTDDSPSKEVTKTVEARRLLSRFKMDLVVEGGVNTLTRLPTRAEATLLKDRLHSLTSTLRDLNYTMTSIPRATVAITEMFLKGAWPNFRPQDVSKMATAYVAGLIEYPPWAIETVCKAVQAGKVEGLNPDYPPSGARIAQLCQEKIADLVTEKYDFTVILGVRVERMTGATQQDRDNGMVKYQAWKADQERLVADADSAVATKVFAEARATSERMILQDYKDRGVQPVVTAGILVSTALLRNIHNHNLAASKIGTRKNKEGGS